jgi:non-ribosomal peptide synthetase-like protein
MSVSKGVHVEARSAGVSTAVRADHSTDRPHSTEPGSVPERALAEVLATILRVDRVSVDGHFFNDLGADSLVMAQFCARVRKRPDLPSVSMKDVYQYPTISALADALAPANAPGPTEPEQPESSTPPPVEVAAPARTAQFILCGVLQLMIFLGYSYLAAYVTAQGFGWISAASGLINTYLRAALFGGALFVSICTLPIVAKWVLIGRWKPQEIRIWSIRYVRFWTLKTMIRANPIAVFVGSPLYSLYLRLLGAKIGRGVVILSKHVPVCTDLLTIGSGTVIRKESYFQGYRAHAGRIQTGAVTLGRDVFIGEKTVIDINTAMGDESQLGHASTLQSGVTVPAGERWHGSPARRTTVNYQRVPPARCGGFRRTSAAILTLLEVFFIGVPLAQGGVEMLLAAVPSVTTSFDTGQDAISSQQFYLDAAVVSLLLFGACVLLGLLFASTVPRILNMFITPEKVYPLYGLHYGVTHAITRLTNIKFFTQLFGNSSYIVYYLRNLGYRLGRVQQTGSNFGDEVTHSIPYLCSVGRGTVIADGLSMINAEYSSTSLRVSRVAIGSRNFLGNNIAYPPHGRTGDNCLLATKVMIPLDGPIRSGVGLLGSPSFEIPRSVERDGNFEHPRSGQEFARSLAAKNRYNLRTMGVFLFVRWFHLFLVTLLGMIAADLYGVLEHAVVGAFFVLSVLLTAAYYVLVERCFTAFRPLFPRLCSYYDPNFWRHERLWKVPSDAYLQVFNGTPFKNVIWRLLGVKLGRGVFDDGCYLTERTLVSIGDHAVLNAGSKVQCHSQEDGAFKSGYTVIGADCTLGVGAFVHYGVTLGDGAILDPDSFLMKGETVPPAARWGGNPATAIAPQEVIGANDPLPVLPIIRPGGRHRTQDEDDQPTPARQPTPAPQPAPAPQLSPAPPAPKRAQPGPSRAPAPASRAAAPRRGQRPPDRSAAEPGRHRVTVEIPRTANRSAELVGVK